MGGGHLDGRFVPAIAGAALAGTTGDDARGKQGAALAMRASHASRAAYWNDAAVEASAVAIGLALNNHGDVTA